MELGSVMIQIFTRSWGVLSSVAGKQILYGALQKVTELSKQNLINGYRITPFFQVPCSHSGSGKTGFLDGSCALGIAAVSCLCHPWIWSAYFWSDSVEISTFVQIVECMQLCLGQVMI